MRIALELIEQQSCDTGTSAGLSLCGDVSLVGNDLTGNTAGEAAGSVRHELPEGETTIGRHECNIIVPARYKNVSRRHAKFIRNGENVTLEDIGSTYGTYVNDVAIGGRSAVKVGDLIRLASRSTVFAEYRMVKLEP